MKSHIHDRQRSRYCILSTDDKIELAIAGKKNKCIVWIGRW
jgi:hypothetical protein